MKNSIVLRLAALLGISASALAQQAPAKATVVLPAEHKLFSARIAQSLRPMQVTQTTARQPIVIPPALATSRAFTLADSQEIAGILECGASKASDRMNVEESAGHLVLSISCQSATLKTQNPKTGKAGPHTLLIAFDKQAVPALFKAATGVPIRPKSVLAARFESKLMAGSAAKPVNVPAGQSKDELEVDHCVSAFQTYKSDPKMNYFHVVFVRRIYHCEVAQSAQLYSAHLQYVRSANPAVNPNSVSPLSAPQLYYEEHDVVPDQHPPDVYTFSHQGVIVYNSQPDPNVKPGLGLQLKNLPPQMVNLAFGANRQPDWTKVAVQIASSASAVPAADPCQGWAKPPNLAVTFTLTPSYHSSIMQNPKTPLDAYKLTGEASLKVAVYQEWATLLKAKNASEFPLYARIVPLNATEDGCAAAPSNWVGVLMHDNYPAEQAEFDRRKKEQATEIAAAGSDGKLGVPINVSIAGYVPYNLDQPDSAFMSPPTMVVGSTPISSDNLNSWGIKHSGGSWQSCSFNPVDVTAWHHSDHSDLDSPLEKAWDDIVLGLEVVGMMIKGIEGTLAEFIVFGVSGGKCPVDDPTGMTPPPPSETKACLDAKVVVTTIVQVVVAALTAGGGSAATASQLINQGAQAAVSEAAAGLESASSSVLTSALSNEALQLAANQAIDQGISKLSQAAVDKINATIGCADPDASAALSPHADLEQQYLKAGSDKRLSAAALDAFGRAAAKDPSFASAIATYTPGSYGFNERGCVVQQTNPDTWGMWNPARLPSPGIVYLRVTPNNTPQSAAVLKIAGNKVMTIVVDGMPWYNPGYVTIDVTRVPAGGMTVPVLLSPWTNKYAKQANVGIPGGVIVYDNDLELGLWMDGRNKPGVQAEFTVKGQYKWTDNTTYKYVSPTVVVPWDARAFPFNTITGVTLPPQGQGPAKPPCHYCDKGDGSALACNQ